MTTQEQAKLKLLERLVAEVSASLRDRAKATVGSSCDVDLGDLYMFDVVAMPSPEHDRMKVWIQARNSKRIVVGGASGVPPSKGLREFRKLAKNLGLLT